jgi:hypothetical protein
MLVATLAALHAAVAHSAEKSTVCTITVNSSDEKEAFRRHLPADRFEFVELVERGRIDWLESARRKGIRCDVLIISGHYDGGDYAGGNEFFSERLDTAEYLPVDEMERIACSDPDNGMFSRLKEVYLFGCNTLNPEPLLSGRAEIARTLVQSGHAPVDVERLSRALSARYADSSRDRMRQVFKDVPAIYGFSSTAPLGPMAATYLDHYFQSSGARDVGSGRANTRILGYFPGRSLTFTRGSTSADPDAGVRRDVCEFFDNRLSPAHRAKFVHQVLRRDMAEVRLFLDHLEHYVGSLDEKTRQLPEVAPVLDEISQDRTARDPYLAFARSDDRSAVRVRMIRLAGHLGWLSAEDTRAELIRLLGDEFARSRPTAADVDLVCGLNEDRQFDEARRDLPAAAVGADDVGHAAMLACLGGSEGRARVLQALTSPRDADVQIAQVYLRRRPISDIHELRRITTEIAQMADGTAQVRALDTLAYLRLSDPVALQAVTRLFVVTKSIAVQRAIAGILIRSDYPATAWPELVRTLREHRMKSPDGRDLIDVLIDRGQIAS